ncbi:MAG: hypothetical protein ACYS8I_04750 [Planctomycetota bacterium]|jgi:hypothetical protein
MVEKLPDNSSPRGLVTGCVVLIAAIPLAYLIHIVSYSSADNPEKGIMVLGAIFAIIVLLPLIACWKFRLWRDEPSKLGLILIATICALLISIYFYWVSFYMFFPADILMWGENDVISDVTKLRAGYPIYSSPLNNESQVYPPGAQTIIYAIVRLLGDVESMPLYRMVQCGFNLLTALFAASSCRHLMRMSDPELSCGRSRVWDFLYVPLFFLMATNSITNPFVHNIHNDSLFQLGVIVAYWLLLKYGSRLKLHILVAMAVLPGLGFLIKQNFVMWILLYSLFILFFDKSRSIRRLILFGAIALPLLAAVIGGCFLAWGDNFTYWVFTVLGNRQISVLRSFQHILDAWPYCAVGLLGGLTVIQGGSYRQLLGIWLVWLLLFLAGAYTSGAAWTLSHMGPGSVIAGIWFVAAITKFWTTPNFIDGAESRLIGWMNTAIAVALSCLLFSGLGFIRIPLKPVSDDAYRYVKEIENEFEGESPENVLLDAGSWIYLKNGTVMKDRATAIGDRGFQGMGGFSQMTQRIEEKQYSKILVRGFHRKDFWYDNDMWRESSGIRKALQENYVEKGTIRAVSKTLLEKESPYLFGDISVLIRKTD